MPQVFISYSHDNHAHKTRVSDFVSRLRSQDITVVYDEDIDKSGGPDEGWPRWCERQIIESDYVLACCTPMFHERFEGNQQPDTGRGVAWEAQTIRQYLYDHPNANRKVRVLILDEADRAYIPNPLRPFSVFLAAHDESFEKLLGWLRITPASAAPPQALSVDWPPPADDFARRLANRSEEFDRLKSMLSGRSLQRALLIQGPSNSGKTALIHECIAYAEHRGVPHSHVDFKGGGTSLDGVFNSLLLDLGQAILGETFSGLRSARTHAVIADLQRLRRPLLLTFDTYNEASEDSQNWIETQLLSRIGRCPALVVALAGQIIPEKSARSWAPLAYTVALPPIRSVEEWIDFAGRSYGLTRLKREHVEAVTIGMDGNPGQVSAMIDALVQRLPTS